LTGHAALFKGDYKIVKNRGPVGDDAWHLFDIVNDPGETTDLKEEMPQRFAEMMEAYRTYAAENNVLPVPEDYNYFNALRAYSTRTQLKAHWPAYAGL
jgi:arylsulfatase A-like enzyme